MRRVLLKAVGLLSAVVIIVASCLLIGQDQQESSEPDAFESETCNIDTIRERGYAGLVSHCSLEGGVDQQAAWSEPGLQMNIAVAVISAPNQLSRRQVVRSTWANSSSYVTRFFIGVVDDEEMEKELKKEEEEFKDICRLSLRESYQGLLHKVLAVFSWFREATPVNILLKVDDDVLFDPDRLELILQLGHQTKQTQLGQQTKQEKCGALCREV